MTVKLRYYQRNAIDEANAFFASGERRGVIVLPTGAGKSLVAGGAAAESADSGRRTLCLTSTKELVAQNADACRRYDPRKYPGVFCAGLGRKDVNRDIIFGSSQSVVSATKRLGRFDRLIWDEAHQMGRQDGMRSQRIVADLLDRNPDMELLGMSASPWRMDSGHICEPIIDGDKEIAALFDSIIYEESIRTLMNQGYLSRLIGKNTDGAMRAAQSGVKLRAGDFAQGELEDAVNNDSINAAIVREALAYGGDRKCWLTFAVGRDHCYNLAMMFNAAGIETEVLLGDTPDAKRDEIVRRHRAGALRNVCSVGVCTTGYDVPFIDLIIDAAATLSIPRHYQKMGRAFRTVYADGMPLETDEDRLRAIASGPKPNAMILDFAGNVDRHGCLDLLDGAMALGKKPSKKKEYVKTLWTCHTCSTMFPVEDKKCPDCGTEIPAKPERPSGVDKLSSTASTGLIISDGSLQSYVREGQRLEKVKAVTLNLHPGSNGKRPTVRVTHAINGGTVSDFVQFGGSGFARDNAVRWFKTRFKRRWWADMPKSSEEMMELYNSQCDGEPIGDTWSICPDYIVIDDSDGYARVRRSIFPYMYNPSDRAGEDAIEKPNDETNKITNGSIGSGKGKSKVVWDDT